MDVRKATRIYGRRPRTLTSVSPAKKCVHTSNRSTLALPLMLNITAEMRWQTNLQTGRLTTFEFRPKLWQRSRALTGELSWFRNAFLRFRAHWLEPTSHGSHLHLRRLRRSRRCIAELHNWPRRRLEGTALSAYSMPSFANGATSVFPFSTQQDGTSSHRRALTLYRRAIGPSWYCRKTCRA